MIAPSPRGFRASVLVAALLLCLPVLRANGPAPDVLPGTNALKPIDDMPWVIGRQWDALLLREIESARRNRETFWAREYSSAAAYGESIAGNRGRFRHLIGAIDERVPVTDLERVAGLEHTGIRAETSTYSVLAVRWPVLRGVQGEGLLLRPRGQPVGFVVAVPDADQTPEMLMGLNPGIAPDSQFPRRLAESGFMVLVPTLLDRRSRWAGDERLEVFTDQSHREWIYRQAGDVGRHPIGYEVQKIQAAIDWFISSTAGSGNEGLKVGVAGFGEGGLLALYTAALDERVDAAWVSGYFQPREKLWQEPLYRNVWGLLAEFGDAELAAMIAPRGLVLEHSRHPEVTHPLAPDPAHERVRKIGGAGRITTPDYTAVKSEWERAKMLAGRFGRKMELHRGDGHEPVEFGSPPALNAFARLLGAEITEERLQSFAASRPFSIAEVDARQQRQVRELQEFTQGKIRLAEYEREKFFWSKVEPGSADTWNEAVKPFREFFWDEVIGRFAESNQPINPRTRRLPEYCDDAITTYEVLLDVLPGVLTWGYLILPTGLKPDERRPVVVCQHGAGGQPSSTLVPDGAYRDYARRLARRGFIVYAPYNPNKLLHEEFRQLQRKGNLIKKTVFGIFAANHQRALEWLKQLEHVDGGRMAFYGLSYGGKTAMRVPPVIEDYCLVICSGDFNDYLPKVTLPRSDKNTFMFGDAYENVQFNLGNTFNYAEMAALIAPRPFMVEHGYKDRVAPLEWAAAEYSKVQKLYFYLGIPEKTAMAFFDGPHMIHGQETFEFLHRHLSWPEPGSR